MQVTINGVFHLLLRYTMIDKFVQIDVDVACKKSWKESLNCRKSIKFKIDIKRWKKVEKLAEDNRKNLQKKKWKYKKILENFVHNQLTFWFWIKSSKIPTQTRPSKIKTGVTLIRSTNCLSAAYFHLNMTKYFDRNSYARRIGRWGEVEKCMIGTQQTVIEKHILNGLLNYTRKPIILLAERSRFHCEVCG